MQHLDHPCEKKRSSKATLTKTRACATRVPVTHQKVMTHHFLNIKISILIINIKTKKRKEEEEKSEERGEKNGEERIDRNSSFA